MNQFHGALILCLIIKQTQKLLMKSQILQGIENCRLLSELAL